MISIFLSEQSVHLSYDNIIHNDNMQHSCYKNNFVYIPIVGPSYIFESSKTIEHAFGKEDNVNARFFLHDGCIIYMYWKDSAFYDQCNEIATHLISKFNKPNKTVKIFGPAMLINLNRNFIKDDITKLMN